MTETTAVWVSITEAGLLAVHGVNRLADDDGFIEYYNVAPSDDDRGEDVK